MLSISETKHVLTEILRGAVTVFEVHCLLRIIDTYRIKAKAVPLHAWSSPEGSRKLKFPDFTTTAQDGCQPYAPAPFTPRKCSWYSFLLEAESTPGPLCDLKDFMSMKNANDASWDRTSDLPICSTAP